MTVNLPGGLLPVATRNLFCPERSDLSSVAEVSDRADCARRQINLPANVVDARMTAEVRVKARDRWEPSHARCDFGNRKARGRAGVYGPRFGSGGALFPIVG